MTLQWALGQPCNMNLNANTILLWKHSRASGRDRSEPATAALTLLLGPSLDCPLLWLRILTTCSQRKHGAYSKGTSTGFVVKRLLGSDPSSSPSPHMPLGKGCHSLAKCFISPMTRKQGGVQRFLSSTRWLCLPPAGRGLSGLLRTVLPLVLPIGGGRESGWGSGGRR